MPKVAGRSRGRWGGGGWSGDGKSSWRRWIWWWWDSYFPDPAILAVSAAVKVVTADFTYMSYNNYSMRFCDIGRLNTLSFTEFRVLKTERAERAEKSDAIGERK